MRGVHSCSGGDGVSTATKGEQAVRLCRQETQVAFVLVCEQHSDVPGEPLQEQLSEEDVVMLLSRAQLPHVSEEFRGFSAA